MVHQEGPVGQVVKTPPSHGGNTSSNLVRVTIFLLVGANGEEVPPVPIPNTEVKLFCAYDTWSVSSWEIEHSAVNRVVVGSSPTGGAK